jgi:capsular exopolysaccharide synthesis family protein
MGGFKMELRQYLDILLRRKVIVIVVALVVIEVVAVGSSLMTSVYSASTLVRVATLQESSIEYIPLEYSERVLFTNVHLLESRPFLEEVIDRLGLRTSPGSLARRISIEILPNTELLEITAEAENPLEAVDIADTLGQLLIEQRVQVYDSEGQSAVQNIEEQLLLVEQDLAENRAQLDEILSGGVTAELSIAAQDLDTRIRIQEETYASLLNEFDKARIAEALRANSITIVEPAIAPNSPSKPDIPLNIALGAVLGISGGVGLAFLVDNLDTTIRTAEDLERVVRAPVLGQIPAMSVSKNARESGLLLDDSPRSPANEAFRVLRTNLLSMKNGQPPKMLLVTSAEPGVGKSTVVSNLAVVLAQSGNKVILVDSDFGRPNIHKIFGLANNHGLTTVLQVENILDEVLNDTKVEGLSVLTSGPIPSNPGDLLQGQKLTSLISELSGNADYILFDGPPLLAIADATMMATELEAVLIVAGRRKVNEKTLQKALHQLEFTMRDMLIQDQKPGR